jgi:Cu/Ag efflux protein CusF
MRTCWTNYFFALTFALLACGKSDPPDRRYHTRGLVVRADGEGVAIHHERIEAFEDRDGKPSAMDSMQMLFGAASDVDAALFKPGAKLAFDFDVRWAKQPTLLIVKAEPLGSETELVLEQDGHHKH